MHIFPLCVKARTLRGTQITYQFGRMSPLLGNVPPMASIRRRVFNFRPTAPKKTNSKVVSCGLYLYPCWIWDVVTYDTCLETSLSQGVLLVKGLVCQEMGICMTIVVHQPRSFSWSGEGQRLFLPHTALNLCLKKHKWNGNGFLYLFIYFLRKVFYFYASTDEIHKLVSDKTAET